MSTRTEHQHEGHFNGHFQDTRRSPLSSILARPPTGRSISQGESEGVREKLQRYAHKFEQWAIELSNQRFEVAARIAIFVIYFWFGILKLIGASPAFPLAAALTSHTIGMQYFNMSFKALAVYECGLGIMFLIPALTRASIVLLVIHMGIVWSPLIIVSNVAFSHPFAPTLEGQYIIKNLAIIALAIGIVARQPKRQRQESAQEAAQTEARPQAQLAAAAGGPGQFSSASSRSEPGPG